MISPFVGGGLSDLNAYKASVVVVGGGGADGGGDPYYQKAASK